MCNLLSPFSYSVFFLFPFCFFLFSFFLFSFYFSLVILFPLLSLFSNFGLIWVLFLPKILAYLGRSCFFFVGQRIYLLRTTLRHLFSVSLTQAKMIDTNRPCSGARVVPLTQPHLHRGNFTVESLKRKNLRRIFA